MTSLAVKSPKVHRGTGDSNYTGPASNPQLSLLSQNATPDSPLRIEPYRLTPGAWWCCIDTHTGRSFGGRYSAREVDRIAAKFRDWPARPIDPGVFGRIAERAIRDTQGFCCIPSDKSDRCVGGAL